MDCFVHPVAQLNTDLINDIKVIETTLTKSTIVAIPSFSGTVLSVLIGETIQPSVPSGYSLVGNVNITVNGLTGLNASFDGANQHTAVSVNPYIYNARSNEIPANATVTIRLYSLCVKYNVPR